MHMDFSLLTLHFRQAFFTFNFSFLIAQACLRSAPALRSSLKYAPSQLVGDNSFNYFNSK